MLHMTTTTTSAPLIESILRLKHCCEMQEAKIVATAALSPAECVCLRETPSAASIDAGSLCLRMRLSPSRGGRVIESLVQRGLLARQTHANDRRVCLVTLTKRGRARQRRLDASFVACDAKLGAKLSPRERHDIDLALGALLRALEQP